MIYTPYSLPLFLAAGLLAGLGIYALRSISPPVGRIFALLVGLGALWDVLYALDLSTTNLALRIFWLQLRIIPLAFISPIILALTLEYRGMRAWLTRRRLALLLIIPLASIGLSLTSSYHHLFRYNFRLDDSGPLLVLLADRGPAFFLYLAYSYSLSTLSVILLIVSFRSRSLYLRDTLLLLAGASIPFCADLVYQLGLTSIRGLNPAPVCFIFTGLFYGWAFRHYRMFSVVPIARNAILESMHDLVIVLNRSGKIIDYNQATQAAMGLSSSALGKSLKDLPSEWAEPLSHYAIPGLQEEVQLVAAGRSRIFEISVTPIQDRGGQALGDLVLLHELTARKQAEQALQQRNRRLADLNGIVASITSSLALEQTLKHVLDATPHFFPGVYSAAVQLVNEEDGRLRTNTASKNVSLAAQQMTFQPGEGIAGLVFQERRPHNVLDITTDPRYTPPPVPPQYRSLLAAPLLYQEEVLGVLCITASQPNAFGEEDVVRLEGLAGYAAIAVKNAHLYEQTLRDAETKSNLLREVNHRIRNNLVSIRTLLMIEKTQAGTKPAGQILDDLSERVRAQLVIHDLLSKIHWEAMPAEVLVREVVQSALSISPIHEQIQLVIESQAPKGERSTPLMIAPHQATHIALALNELATNSAKYAFTGRQSGRIDILLRAIDDTPDLNLRYHDDGPGWPEDVLAGQRENIGLGLIRSAARDQVILSNQAGAAADLTFGFALVEKTLQPGKDTQPA